MAVEIRGGILFQRGLTEAAADIRRRSAKGCHIGNT